MRNWTRYAKSQAGLSLVEATIILLVLSIMTSVLAPEIQGYIELARKFKAKEDCEAIGVSLQRLRFDTGYKFLTQDPQATGTALFSQANRVDLLVSTGAAPTTTSPDATDVLNIDLGADGFMNWNSTPEGDMAEHMITNNISQSAGNGYTSPLTPGVSLTGGHGWRGAYLSPNIGPDPWGNYYLVNSVYFGTALDSSDAEPGGPGTGWPYDTMCISAGPNQNVETDFEHDGVTGPAVAFTQNTGTNNNNSDDTIYVISGFGG